MVGAICCDGGEARAEGGVLEVHIGSFCGEGCVSGEGWAIFRDNFRIFEGLCVGR